MEYLSHFDLGKSLLTISVAIGWLLLAAVVYRSFEIGFKVFLDRRRAKNQSVSGSQKGGRGF